MPTRKRTAALAVTVLVLAALLPAIATGGAPPQVGPSGELVEEDPDGSPQVQAGQQDVSETKNVLDTVVVTATRTEEESFYVPHSVDALSEDEITTRKATRTLPEALREVPGVMVQKTGHGQGSPFLRGFTGFRTLFLIDGIRLNNSVMRDGPNQYWNTVDPLTIERLEVVKGPSSVLYGSDAIGGTVNAITRSREPAATEEETFDPGGRAYYRFGSAEDSHTVRGELSGSYNPYVGALGGVSYRNFGDLRGGREVGLMPYTGYEELNGDLKTVIRAQPDLDLVLAFQRLGQDAVPRTHSTVFSKSWEGTDVGTDLQRELDQTRTLGYLQAHWKPETVSWVSRLSCNLSYHLQEEEEVRTRSNLRTRNQGVDDGTLGTWIQLESPSPIGVLTYGVEYYHDEVSSFYREYNEDGSLREERPRGSVADDSTYELVGVYVQDSVRPVEPMEIILGGRFNYANAFAQNVDPDPTTDPQFGPVDEDFYGLVGSLRVLVEATESWNIFGGASQGFRAPNLSDLTRFDVSRSGEVEIPAPDLKEERYLTLEIGSKILFEDLGLRGYGSYHYTFIDGMIVRFPTGDTIDGDPVVTKANVGDGFVHGVELGLSWNFYDGFTAFGSFTWLHGDVDTMVNNQISREPMSRIQPLSGLLGLRWEAPSKRFWVEGTVLLVNRQDRLSPRDEADTQRIPPGGTPGYIVVTIRGGVEVLEGLHLFTALENLGDVDYRVHGSGQNEAGTNVIVGADWRF